MPGDDSTSHAASVAKWLSADWKEPVGTVNSVTDEFLRSFKTGDLVDVRVKHIRWTGPHKLLVYKIDRTKDQKPAAYIKIKLGEEKLERWLIEGDRQIIRKHISQEQKQPARVKPV